MLTRSKPWGYKWPDGTKDQGERGSWLQGRLRIGRRLSVRPVREQCPRTSSIHEDSEGFYKNQ
jgi:hypothetical protein